MSLFATERSMKNALWVSRRFFITFLVVCMCLFCVAPQTKAQDSNPEVLFAVKGLQRYVGPAGDDSRPLDLGFGPTITTYNSETENPTFGASRHIKVKSSGQAELKIEVGSSLDYIAMGGPVARNWTESTEVTVWVKVASSSSKPTYTVEVFGELKVNDITTILPDSTFAQVYTTASASYTSEALDTWIVKGEAGKSYRTEYDVYDGVSVSFPQYPGALYMRLKDKITAKASLDHAFYANNVRLQMLADVTQTIRVCPVGGCPQVALPVRLPVDVITSGVCDDDLFVRPGSLCVINHFGSTSGKVQDLLDAGISFFEMLEIKNVNGGPPVIYNPQTGDIVPPPGFSCLLSQRTKGATWCEGCLAPIRRVAVNDAKFSDRHGFDAGAAGVVCTITCPPPAPGFYVTKQQYYYVLPNVNNGMPVLFAEYEVEKGVRQARTFGMSFWGFYVKKHGVPSRHKLLCF